MGGPIEATDADDDTPTYALSGADAAMFRVRSNGQIEVSDEAMLNYESKNTYMVTLTATDSSGESNDNATITVTIHVINVDEAPVIMVGSLGLAISGMSRIDYAENGMGAVETYTASGPDAASATWSLSGDDAGDFRISRAGVLTFRTSPDFENPADANTDNVYMVTVKANDGTSLDTHDVTVTVTNVDEMGRVTFWRDGADATTAAIMVGDELGGAVDDSDGNPGDTFPIAMYMRITAANITSWQWARSMDMTDWDDIGTGGMYTVMDADAGYYLRATAMYTTVKASGR